MAVAVALAGGVRGLAGDAALLLLVGGLCMLSLIVALVILQGILPDRSPPPGHARPAPGRELRPVRGAPPPHAAGRRRGGRQAGRRRHQLSVDRALGLVVEEGHGEPRLLQARHHRARVRLYGCRGCLVPGDAAGCHFERDALDEAFRTVFGGQVKVRETACRSRNDLACEFEVRL